MTLHVGFRRGHDAWQRRDPLEAPLICTGEPALLHLANLGLDERLLVNYAGLSHEACFVYPRHNWHTSAAHLSSGTYL